MLGEDTRSFLACIRSFGRAGLSVHTAWCPLNSPALQSKYVARNHPLPEYRPQDLDWLEAFCNLLWREQFDFVLPCTDAAILQLQTHRDVVKQAGRVDLLPPDVYWTCASKAKTHALARELEIPVPSQLTASDPDSLQAAARQFGFPLVLKPETSSTARDPLHRRTVLKARNSAELLQLGAGLLAGGPVLIEQNVIGIGVGVEFLSKDGEILTAFQHERVHEAPSGGASGYRRSVPLDSGMYRAAALLAKALRYTGLAMVEFKQNPQTREWVLIEINARVWGSLPLSIAAGLDFPRYLYEMLVENRTDFPTGYRKNFYCRHWTTDLEWLRANAAADRSDPTLLTKSGGSVAAEIFHILSFRESSDTLQIDDPAPAVSDLAQFFNAKAFGLLKRMRFYRDSSGKRAAAAFATAQRPLFVCHGNICRSPFAALCLERLMPGTHIPSSGCYPIPDRSSPHAAIEAAAKFGVDLGSHRSSVLSAAMLDQADLIFIFDQRNRDELAKRFTGFESKLHFLGSLDSESSLEIEDPYGSSVKDFEACYARIEKILRGLTGPKTKQIP